MSAHLFIRLVGIFTFFFLLSACANFGDRASNIFFPKSKNSFERDGEEVTLTFEYHNKGKAPTKPKLISGTDSQGIQQHGLASGEIAAAAGFVVEQISEYLKKESERYTATYSAVAVGDQFYGDWDSDSKVNLKKITLNRTVKSGHAIKIIMDVIPTLDGTAFQLKPSYVHIDRSKAKLAGFALLDPFSWFSDSDDDLDLTVNLKMHAVWRDKKLKVHVQDLAEGEFKIRNIKLGAIYGGDENPKVPGGSFNGKLFPIPARSSLGETLKSKDRLFNLRDLDNYMRTLIPQNALSSFEKKTLDERMRILGIERKDNTPAGIVTPPGMLWVKVGGRSPVLGLGNFVVTILVTEHDDYGKKVKEASEKVGKRKEDVVKAVEKALADK